MKYNGFYFALFSKPMKKVLTEKYNREYACKIMKQSKAVYRKLVDEADDIGADNPMAYNELLHLLLWHRILQVRKRSRRKPYSL